MSGPEQEQVQSFGGVWLLQYGAIVFHNDHIQSGRRKAARCGVCSKGLEGAMATVKEDSAGPIEEPVAESDGVDKEGDSAHSSADRPKW